MRRKQGDSKERRTEGLPGEVKEEVCLEGTSSGVQKMLLRSRDYLSGSVIKTE